jgi:2-polyprenyl-3-methyl-5-hydroxy-6-metoxy-1,4-benzoquinol methylase
MKSANQPEQESDISQAELDRYERLDQEWREYEIAAPARRALVDARLYKVSDLRKISQSDLEQLPGLGKSVIARLKVLMDAKKIKFHL